MNAPNHFDSSLLDGFWVKAGPNELRVQGMLCRATEYKGGEGRKTVSFKKTSDIHRFYPAGAV